MQTHTTLPIRIAIIITVALALSGSVAWAQEKQQSTDGWITKTLKLQHIGVGRFHDLLDKVPGTLERDGELGLLIVYGPPGTVRFVEETVAKVDVPPEKVENRNVEFTAYLLGASRASEAGGEIPSMLGPVVQELRRRFPYDGFRLLETTLLRLRPRENGKIGGVIRDLALEKADPARYELSIVLESVRPSGSGYAISLNNVRLDATIPVLRPGGSVTQAGLQILSKMDMQAGKTVVVGKAGVQGVVDGIFLVLQANVVE